MFDVPKCKFIFKKADLNVGCVFSFFVTDTKVMFGYDFGTIP